MIFPFHWKPPLFQSPKNLVFTEHHLRIKKKVFLSERLFFRVNNISYLLKASFFSESKKSDFHWTKNRRSVGETQLVHKLFKRFGVQGSPPACKASLIQVRIVCLLAPRAYGQARWGNQSFVYISLSVPVSLLSDHLWAWSKGGTPERRIFWKV